MMDLPKQSQPHRFPNKIEKDRSLRGSARCARCDRAGRLRRILARVSPTPVASPGQGFQPVDPTKAFSLWTPDEGPCPIDPREERSALTHPDQPSPDWMRPSPGAES